MAPAPLSALPTINRGVADAALRALPARLDDLPDWIVRQATASNAADDLLEGVCRTLLAAGLPLWRASLGTPTLDPVFRGVSVNWWRDKPIETVPVARGLEEDASFQRSPVYAMVADGRTAARWRIAEGEGCNAHPILAELRDGGGTDYLLRVVGFAEASGVPGAFLSIATDRLSGFTAEDAAAIDRVLPSLGLATFRLISTRTLREALAIYLGPSSGARVLAGEIQRGQGRTMAAAILLADLRDFTGMTDREDPVPVVAWLDEHLEAVGEPVAEHGGEILKFLGDGLLAVFPVEDRAARPCAVCDRALKAAEAALENNAALNRRRAASGGPGLDLDVVLHYGDVVYGNVGTPRRLDFTVIGRAVNEASRIEDLCEAIGRNLLCSEAFAERCGRDLARLGAFAMKGVAGTRTIWGV